MVRPRWLLALLLALATAGGFAWLGHWQLERAVVSDVVSKSATETPKPLTRTVRPGAGVPGDVVGQKVTVSGAFVPDDYQLLTDRLNNGASGFWVVGHLALSQPDAAGRPVALAVARGWAPDRAAAQKAVAELEAQPAASAHLSGRLLPSEGPIIPDPGANPQQMKALSAAALYNLWSGVGNTDVYDGYVVEKNAPAGLTDIDSPPPIPQETVNWLNLFYAVEWVVFAGFSIYLWYRLVRDARERELLLAGDPADEP